MQKENIYKFMNNNPVFSLATVDNGFPKVRGMLLYRADENGIVFHTGSIKDVYRQINENPYAELCFINQLFQVRVSGVLKIIDNNAIKDEISAHPSRGFVQEHKNSIPLQEFYDFFMVLNMQEGKAKIWTMKNNLDPCKEILLD